jgi:hypothetical protein
LANWPTVAQKDFPSLEADSISRNRLSRIAKVTARVTNMVICVSHAPVTLRAANSGRSSVEQSSPTPLEGWKMENLNNNICRLTYKKP